MMFFNGESIPYEPPRMSDQQMWALEYLVVQSKNATDFGKKAVIWLLRQSHQLTQRVALCAPYETIGEQRAGDIQNAVHDMVSCNGSTHLHEYFRLMGTLVSMSHHCGLLSESPEPKDAFDSMAPGRTIWCSYYSYDREAKLFFPSKRSIDCIDLSHAQAQLYPFVSHS